MTFDEIRNKFFAVADSRTFETIFDYIFNVYNLNMLLQERKYVPPDRAWSYEVKNDTHILIGYTGKVFFTLRKTPHSLLLDEGTESQIELIGDKAYHYGKEIPLIDILENRR